MERGGLGMDQAGQLGEGEHGPLPPSATCGAQPMGSFAAVDPEVSCGVNLTSLTARPGAQRLLSCERGACPAGSVLTRGVRSVWHIMFINMP